MILRLPALFCCAHKLGAFGTSRLRLSGPPRASLGVVAQGGWASGVSSGGGVSWACGQRNACGVAGEWAGPTAGERVGARGKGWVRVFSGNSTRMFLLARPCPLGVRGEQRAVFLWALQWFPALFREKGSLWRDGQRRAERGNGSGRTTAPTPRAKPRARPSTAEISRTCRPTGKSPRTFPPQTKSLPASISRKESPSPHPHTLTPSIHLQGCRLEYNDRLYIRLT